MNTFSELLRGAQGGEPAAISELHRRFGPQVLTRVRARLGPLLRRRYDTLDLGQSVFADVIARLPRFEDRGESAFRHWLYIQAENKIRSKLRRHLGRAGMRREVTLAEEHTAALPTRDPGPDELAEREEERVRLLAVLDDMEPEERQVLTLRGQHRLPFAEVARQIGVSNANVARMRYVRAMVALRKRWKTA